MPKTDGGSKFKSSRRKPLRDVSNGVVKSLKSTTKKMKLNKEEQLPHHPQIQQSNYADPLDRLLLVHSDISSLLRQIDELVVQAVKVDTTDNERITEIKSFTTVLSEIHSSLKPWVPRLQKALDVSHSESEIQFGETHGGACLVADQGNALAVDTPKSTKHESLVSPSPLVSWRATGCVEERGKQLFFLTPLLRPRTTTSKAHASSKLTVCEGITSSLTSIFASPSVDDDNNEKVKIVSENLESISDTRFVSAQKNPQADFSTNLITPCLKKPPLRTCVMHELDHEPSCKNIAKSHKSTPFPTGNKTVCDSTDSDSSSGEAQEKLGLKYPELIGIKPSYMSKNGSRALETSPAWITSPPKCCTLLEPLNEKHPKDDASLQELASTFNQQLCLAPMLPKESNIENNVQDKEKKKFSLQGNIRSNFAKVESTPLWKGSESTIHRSKRPGENTLKRELWTKFEAASTGGCHLNFPVCKDTSHKGFLEMLEEASCDESIVCPDAFR